MKLVVQAAKRMANRRWGERSGNNFVGNIKMSWKEVKRVRQGEQATEEMVKDVNVNGQILRVGIEVRRRWAEYFMQVLNVADVMEATINWQMLVFRNLNERAISFGGSRGGSE